MLTLFKMLRCLVRKCSIVICFLMICPARTVRQAKLHRLKPPVPIEHDTTDKMLLNKFAGKIESVVQSSAETTGVDEAGFDLTSEEMAKFKIWPNGVVPYYIDVYSYSDKVLRDRIRGFLNSVSGLTSLNFLELASPPNDENTRWVFFINRRRQLGCGDHTVKNFTNKGIQRINLGYDCMSTGGELAEAVLAIAGVPPQHNAPNRDKYIRISDQNIMPDKKQLFAKLNNDEWLFHDIEYDFASAGHYHPHKYSQNGKATIEMQDKYKDVAVGESNGLSSKDIIKIKMLYNFIAKKKQNISECHKLFAPGSKFDTYQPADKPITPRKKPSLYTGLAADNIVDLTPKHTPEKGDSHEVLKHEESDNDEGDESVRNPNEFSDHPSMKNQPPEGKTQLSLKKDPLSYLSDYKSSEDENVKKKNLAFGRPGLKGKHGKKILGVYE